MFYIGVMTDLRQRFETLRDAQSVATDDLDQLWADLRPVTVAEILGPWRGGDFSTGHVISTVLEKSRWHGKRFDSALEAKPLICRDDDGELYSNTDAAGGGEASLWEVEFRGETTATMVYDKLPVFDHFKAVDEYATTLMGIMNGKLASAFGIDDLYYFWLERDR
jgi:hypothetical protein